MNLTIDSSLQHIMYNGNAVQKLIFNGHEVWSAYHPHDYSLDYLTIVSTSDNNTIKWKAINSSLTKTISISTNNGQTWTNKTSTTSGVTLATLNTGDKLLIKGSNSTYGNTSYHNYFTSTGQFNVEGNIMSLIYGDNFSGQTTLSATYTFRYLFYTSYVVDASNLILPATTLTSYCYNNMFHSCKSLITAPALPATTLIQYCYYGMFRGCTALNTTPILLPAIALADSCYRQMFYGCTSLTTAPILPATTLKNNCYSYMFYGCTALNYIKCLATNISATTPTNYWVNGVAATGTFVKDVDMTGWATGNNGIPTNWTVQDSADYSYKYLTIVSTAANNSISWATKNSNVAKTISVSTDGGSTWTSKTSTTSGVTLATLNTGDKLLIKGSNSTYGNTSYYNYFTSSGQFNVEGNIMSLIYGDNFSGQTTLSSIYTFKYLFYSSNVVDASNLILPATKLVQYCYQCMFRECTSLTTVPELPATTLVEYCYYGMFRGCTTLTTAPALPATTLADSCYSNMFQGCTNLTTAPALPATTLIQYCYSYMFYGCTTLTTAPVLRATTLVSNCYTRMFQNCSKLNYIKALFTTTPSSTYTGYWVSGVASTGTFVKNSSATWNDTGVNGVPSGWTVQTASS